MPSRPISRPIETYGVKIALDRIRDDVAEDFADEYRAWLAQERVQGRLELSEDNLDVLTQRAAQIASQQARTKAGTAVGETWVLAINKGVTDAQHSADTPLPTQVCPACGAPQLSRTTSKP